MKTINLGRVSAVTKSGFFNEVDPDSGGFKVDCQDSANGNIAVTLQSSSTQPTAGRYINCGQPYAG